MRPVVQAAVVLRDTENADETGLDQLGKVALAETALLDAVYIYSPLDDGAGKG